MLKKEMVKVTQEELDAEEESTGMKERLEDDDSSLENTEWMHSVKVMEQKSYKHMLNRMSQDQIAMTIHTNDLHESLKDKKLIVKSMYLKRDKAKEDQLQSKFTLDNLMKNIDKEQEQRQDRIKSLYKSIQNKEEAMSRRMERANRQKVIANEAAAENKDSEEEKKREEFMV